MGHGAFQDIWKLPDQIGADLGTPLIQGLLDTVSKLLAVRGRALFPQAAPVEQVPCLQVQSAGPRQERPGRAAVGAHGSCRLEGGGWGGEPESDGAADGAGWEDGGHAGRGVPGPRGEREAADSARPRPGVCARARGGRAATERRSRREALARTAAAASAATAAGRELFPGRQ